MDNTDAKPVVAESSAAPVPTQENLDTMNADQRKQWRMTGKVPETQVSPQADSTPAKENSDATPKEPAESAPASEAGNKEHRDNAATRLKELLADLKNAGFTPAELKTFKKEAAKTTQAESSPAKQPEVKAAPALEAPKEPAIDDPKYAGADGWTKYEADVRQFNKDFAKYEAAQAVENYKKSQAEAQQLEQLNKELAAARGRYTEFDEIVAPLWTEIATDKSIHEDVREFVGRSPVMVDLMYTIGGNADTKARFLAAARSDKYTALRYAMEAERLVLADLSKGKEAGKNGTEAARNENGQFVKTDAPSKKVTSAPNPPSEVGGKGTVPADEIADALTKGDFKRYKDLKNRQEMAAKKGG